MRRRALLILAVSLLLVIPAVVAVAASGSDVVGTSAVTADQVQEQARDCGDCLYGATALERDQVRARTQDQVAEDRPGIQEQKQLRIHEPGTGIGDQVQARERMQVRDESNCDGDGMQLREQARTETQRRFEFTEPQGGQPGFGPGAETGNGSLHEGPANGTGNQFGQGGR